ncbi:kinase-like protein [Piedraia hortae CBS 480.64]|uniref:non-specific serine/threonine protein kinase n=1 Tax=Piedraia hortae CBS 480.64 TaxID=1314780 RepID=A0A6A7C697_9PEZI|nr:kinase-like protein [Piedraia hortae CBS 480.64]
MYASRQTRVKDKYKVIRKYGPTGGGQASLAKNCVNSRLVVIKEIAPFPDDQRYRRQPFEVKVLDRVLRMHPNIILLKEFWEAGPPRHTIYHAVFECCTGGDLDDFINHWIKKRAKWVPSLFVKHYVAEMASALGYLHNGIMDIQHPEKIVANHSRIIHCDIKPGNIFMRWDIPDRDGLPILALGDFGLACFERDSVSYGGTPGYFPPECKLADKMPAARAAKTTFLSSRSDMYCFGGVLWSIITTNRFDNRIVTYTPPSMLKYIADCTIAQDAGVMRLLTDSLRDDPRRRPSTSELVRIGARLQRKVRVMTREVGLRMPPGSYPKDIL